LAFGSADFDLAALALRIKGHSFSSLTGFFNAADLLERFAGADQPCRFGWRSWPD
jgi:hypothetical protein